MTPAKAALGERAAGELTGELLLLLAGLAALGALATNIILPAFPGMALALHASTQDLGATLSSFFVAFALGQLLVGPLSDRYGRKWLVLGGLLTFALGSAICILALSLPQLIAGRIVQALGVCATSVLARAIARDLFEGEQLARVLALIMVAMAAAPGFSPLVGQAFNHFLGWRATFGFVGLLALVLAVHYSLRLGETHRAAGSALSLRAVLAGYGRLLGERRFIAPALAVSLVIGALYAFFAMAPAILMDGFGLSALAMGLFFAATVLVVFAAGWLAPRLARRWGAAAVVRAGLGIALAGSLALLVGPQDFIFFSAALSVFLLGMGILNPLGTAIALQPFAQQAGAASALLGFLQMGCAAAAITLGSAGASAYGALGVLWSACVAAALLVFWRTE